MKGNVVNDHFRVGRAMGLLGLLSLLLACSAPEAPDMAGPVADWPVVGADNGGSRYSPLTQIDRHNVARLKVAWQYRSGDVPAKGDSQLSALQVTPIVVRDSLYFCTPFNRVIALDPENGREKWAFDPQVNREGLYSLTCRGVAHWQSARTDETGACRERIFLATLDARLIALDAATGARCTDFASQGERNLLDGLGEVRPGEYYSTSAPLVVGDVVLTGAFIKDGQRTDAPGGVIRAFDVRSGELRWAFDPVGPGQPPVTVAQNRAGVPFTRGTPNVWGLMSADDANRLVFLPTGNPSPDHYAGAERGQRDHYGSSVVALDADSGAVRWHFRTVHRDVWDYDVAAQPVLFDWPAPDGRSVPAVAVATKAGHIFLLDRLNGTPLFPVEERAVPASDVPGEWTAPTQPFPTLPKPVHPATLTDDGIWGLTPWQRKECLQKFHALRYDGIFTPPSLQGSLVYPGLGGGINWGSVSIDPQHHRLVVNTFISPFTVQLVPRDKAGMRLDGGDQLGANPQDGTPYVVVRAPFLSSAQTPCVAPPWGALLAIDLASGERRWESTLGTLKGLAPLVGGFLNWGTPSSGGAIQTAGGLVFIAATMDRYFRAFDADTGEELWRDRLPYAGHAVPLTYRLGDDARQYVVIAAGGHGALGTETGDVIVAYTLAE